jgi:hypothetical protein
MNTQHSIVENYGYMSVWCGFERASSIMCGNKMPTRCNWWVFIADLIACSTCFGHHYAHHQELESIIQVVCCLSHLVLGFQAVGIVCSWGLCVWFAGCCSNPQTGHTTLSSTLHRQLENQAPNTTGGNHLHNTLELLMMGIMVPETVEQAIGSAIKTHLLHLVGILCPHIIYTLFPVKHTKPK